MGIAADLYWQDLGNALLTLSFFCYSILVAEAAPIIEVKDLVKNFGDFVAVKGVSFAVKEGEIFGILGPNGAGKTTTMEIIETLQPPTHGEVIVDGYNVVQNPWEVKIRIGVQLQSAGFYPQLSLIDIINMFAAFYGRKVDPMALLKEVDLEDKADSFYDKLSGGQQQRFSIATTLVNDPRIIFLDEPTTGLDPQARIHLHEMIRKINKTGTTIVLTTHYMQEAEDLCDRLAVMDQGEIIAQGTPSELIEKLIKTGFNRKQIVKKATLEDVFISLTGKDLRDE